MNGNGYWDANTVSAAKQFSAIHLFAPLRAENEETCAPEVQCCQPLLIRCTESSMATSGARLQAGYGPRFAREIADRLTEGLNKNLPCEISERLRKARELAIAARRK